MDSFRLFQTICSYEECCAKYIKLKHNNIMNLYTSNFTHKVNLWNTFLEMELLSQKVHAFFI